jgi:hypothetical protein
MPKTPSKIAELFSEDIYRNIEEVIKVDELRDEILLDEIREYHPTPSIQAQMAEVLGAYSDLRRGPTDKVGVWISGFFGAGKSSFAKLLGVLLESRKVGGQDAVDLFSKRITSDKIKVLLRQIREHLPTHVVMFDILKDHVAGAREHPVTTVMYRALLRSLGYQIDLDLAELEINLEERGELDAFKTKFAEIYAGRTWDEAKRLTMTAFNEASTVLHHLEPMTYPSADSWVRARARADISPRKLAERTLALARLRADGRNVVFVVDEIGQYTARDLSRISDLQGVIESLSLVGKGKIWLVATSQEKLESIVDIYERDRTELARLQDRFAYKVFLHPSDIREVASHRVLAKGAAGEAVLRKGYQEQSGRLQVATELKGTVQLPRLEEDAYVQLYPLLPYQVDLLIDVVSGLRRQASGPQAMGGANRTIIKLAQQLLIHPKVGLGEAAVGRLVTFDNVYELLSTNVSTEIQGEIDEIERQVDHPYAARVARALALLQFAEAVYTTEDNLAAVLHPAIDARAVGEDVREAVTRLIDARKVRRTERGLKIQSAAERTWDEERDSRRPAPGDRARIIKEVLEHLWGKTAAQMPSHQLGGWRRFTAGLRVGSEMLADGDVTFEVRLLEPARPNEEQVKEARGATQSDHILITWLVEPTDAAERAVAERYRSERMQTRGARTKEEEMLLREEGRRLQAANEDLRRELSKALCKGWIFFRGTERSPDDTAADPKVEARRVLAQAVSQVFHRFSDGDVQVSRDDAEAILKTESLAGLPACYSTLRLVETANGKVRLRTDLGAAKEVRDWVRLRCDEGQAPSGRELEQHFRSAPYGWTLELVQLLVAALLRDGQITLTAQGQQIRSALTPEARREIANNTRFRALTVRTREAALDPKKLREAGRTLEERFGHPCPSLTAESISSVLRDRLCNEIPRLEQARDTLRELRLPGDDSMTQAVSALRLIQREDNEGAIQAFLETADTLAKALPRARLIEEKVTDARRGDLTLARDTLQQVGPVLERELEGSDPALEAIARLRDHLSSETFYDHLSAIVSGAEALLGRFQNLYDEAFKERRRAYQEALEALHQAPGWAELGKEDQDAISKRLRERANAEPAKEPWRLGAAALEILRAERQAARSLLEEALAELRHAISPEAVEVHVSRLLNGPITSAEELDTVISAIREAVERALADGKPVVLL